ncbi:MAG: hypothetical protein FWG36_09285 [Oscillospiraceae bacterium]|nr:hypothetical protein [Oscillospiraceae bacterium]
MTLIHLFEREDDTYKALKIILDRAPRFLREFYELVPNYKDGLDFVDFAYGEIKQRKSKVPVERYMRWEICLITLKLEMLDKLGYWEEYHNFFNDMYDKHPHYQGKYAKNAVHLKMARAHPYMISEDGDFLNVHFLYLLLPRYEAICKYLRAKAQIKRKPPVIDEQTAKRNYALLSERLEHLLKLDRNLLQLYR